MNEDAIYRMSDEELEEAFHQAKADLDVDPGQEYEETTEDVEIMEQPEEIEDSIEELGATEEDEVTTEEESTTEDAQPDEEVTEEDEEPTEEIAEDEEEAQEQAPQAVTFKANGKEYKFTPDEIMNQFPKIFGQAMDYTKKTQAMKPWRKTIDAIEQAKLGHDDINLMIDVLKGDKNAIAEVLKKTGVDTLDLDTENSKYTPNDYGRDDNALAIKDIVDEISADKEYEVTHKILSKDWDEASFREMTKDPELIRLLHIDVKNGMYDKVQPVAEKLKVFDRGTQSDLEYYKLAARELAREEQEEQRRLGALEEHRAAREAKLAKQAELERVRQAQAKRTETAVKAVERKAAAPTSRSTSTPKVVDYLDASDEDFENWYQKMQEKM